MPTVVLALLIEAMAPPTPAATEPSKPKVICTWEEVTGSRFAKKVCLTEDQIAKRREAAITAAGELINQPKINPAGKD